MAIIIIRTIIIYLTLLTAMRLMGKRQLGELELSELVVAVLISDIAAQPLQDISIPLLNGILPIIVLLSCELLISGMIVKSPKARLFICGRPSVIIKDGIINQSEMKKNRFTLDELAEELRGQGILDINTIKYAILETDGKLNLISQPSASPVTAELLSIEVHDIGYPLIIINNGKLMTDNLQKSGKSIDWLNNQLNKRGIKSIKDVYYMTVNSANEIYFAKSEEK